MSRLIYPLISIMSLSLCAGIVWWGYALANLDPNDVPVIQKQAGPARIAPKDPGGAEIAHMGLSVNEVQSNGAAAETAPKVVLAPAPTGLSQEDLPGSDLLLAAQMFRKEVDRKADANAAQVSRSLQTYEPELDTAEPAPKRITLTVRDAGTLDIPRQTVQVTSPAPEPVETALAAPAAPLIPENVFRPRARPSNLKSLVTKVAAKTTTDVTPGARLVQFGAFDSRDQAETKWQQMLASHADLLSGKDALIQEAVTGGRRFFRLRAVGFETASDTKSYCSAMIARGQACIPVVAR